MECLNEDILDAEFSDDSRVWVVLDNSDLDTYLYFPKNETTLALWGFTKKESAEHMAFLLKKLAPDYKELTLAIAPDLLKDIREGAKKHKVPVCVMSPNDSEEFFKRYEGFLGRYYGF